VTGLARIRRATRADAAAVSDVYIRGRRGAADYIPTVHTDNEIRDWIANVLMAASEVWVAECEGEIVAMMALDGEQVEQLYVAPEHQRRGAGSRLLAKARELRPRGLRLWTFQRNAPARRFYESHGFRAVEFTDGSANEEREPDVLYEWRSGPL
jgi:GNAT superfamily N-acetyltransferase